MKPNLFVAALLSGVGAIAITAPAAAQSASETSAAPANANAVKDIIVTGSRVITNGNNSPTPVTVVQKDELLKLQPTTLTDALNNLPIFSGSRGQFSNPNTTGLYGGGNPSTSELNLRNLGPQRTLILFDGQRVAPSNAIGIVDVDMIPQMLVKRVDVVTGGASAVYGSDAIAGVVNYVMDNDYNGIKAEGGYGISDRNDDSTYRIGIAAGTHLFGGRGHIEASYNHYEDKGIPRRTARAYSGYALLGSVPGSTDAPGTAGNPYEVFNNVTRNNNSFGGLITNGPLKGQNFTTDGVLSPFVHGAATGTSNSEVGGDGSYGGQSTLKAPVNFDQVFVRFDYDVSDTIRFHAQFSGNWKKSYTHPESAQYNLTFSSKNAFLDPAVSNEMSETPTFTLGKVLDQFPQIKQTANVENYFLSTGLDGDVGRFKWGLDFNYGYNKINDVLKNNINNEHLAAALDAVTVDNQTVCAASLTNQAFSNCKPLDLFGPTAANADAISYVTGTTHYSPTFRQFETNAHIGGELFSLPAGPVNASLSAEWRKLEFWNGSDATPTDPVDCAGIRYNCNAKTTLWYNAFAVGPKVSQSVKEGAIEFNVPLLADKNFFQLLSLNAAARYTSYDYGGNNFTWKIGVDWHINPDVKLRGTVSKDILAPSLSQLFQPLLLGPVTQRDYLTQTNPAISIANVGNPDLVSEVGHTLTGGIVLKPSWLPGFSLSVDGYQVKVTGALTQLQGYNPQLQAECYASGGTSYYCSLQTRPNGFIDTSASNAATAWTAIFANISSIETRGVDVEANYATMLGSHPIETRIFANWQPYYTIAQPGLPTYQEANVAFPNVVPLQAIPAFRTTATINAGVTDNFFVTLTGRYRGRMKASAVPTDVYVEADRHISSLFQADVNLLYRLKKGTELYFNIRNLFDKMPPGVSGLSKGAGYPGIDDPTGRYFSGGFRVAF
jgi:outer membrane receptor protein involved in Fe transport